MVQQMRIKIWTAAYMPFILGGDVYQPLFCEVEAQGPIDLGRGYKGYLVLAPDGSTVVAESTSGGLVGPTIQEVRADIKSGSIAVMRKQVEEAVEKGKTARPIAPEEFWTLMGKGAV